MSKVKTTKKQTKKNVKKPITVKVKKPIETIKPIIDLQFIANQKNLKSVFKKLSIAISTDATRYYLNSVLLEKKGNEINWVATDSHKMVVINALANIDFEIIKTNKETIIPNNDFAYIIPRIAVEDFLKLQSKNYSTVKINFTDNKFISFNYGNGDNIRTYKLLDATYPEWRKVMPTEFKPYVAFSPRYIKQICGVLSGGIGFGSKEQIIFESAPVQKDSKTGILESPSVITNGNGGATFILMPQRIAE